MALKPELQQTSALDARARAVLPGGTTRGLTAMTPVAPRAEKGSGYVITGENGQEWIDLNNNFGALVHGHAHPRVVAEAVYAVQDGASFGMSTRWEIELAELLVNRLGWADQVRFANSGTEAVMAALRVARVASGREKVLLPRPSYHGSDDQALLALGPTSSFGVPSGTKAEVMLVDPFDEDELERTFRESGHELAAYMLDLVPARAGGRPLSASYVKRARELTRMHGVLLIIDEVVSLRHGYSGMAYSHYGVTPDVTALGKIIGGGHPVGAVVGTQEIMRYFDAEQRPYAFHGGTFSGNPVSMRAGIASLELYTVDEVTRLNNLGNRLRDRLNAELPNFGWEATGFGSNLRFDFIGEALPQGWKHRLWWAAQATGILLTPGHLSIALSTPMDAGLVDSLAPTLLELFSAT